VRIRDLIVGFFRADVPIHEIDPYRRAGSDAYDLLDLVAPASWARLAAWNAFVLQVYADNLVSAGTSGRYVTADIAVFARHVYSMANVWLEETRKAQASEAYRYIFRLPHPLPHWNDPTRTDHQLEGMLATLETARTRAASDLEGFQGDEAKQGTLQVRLAQVDSQAGYVGRLWTEHPTFELRCTIGDCLGQSLDRVYELGQLLAQPELLDGLF
jgi:hypothetical protein